VLLRILKPTPNLRIFPSPFIMLSSRTWTKSESAFFSQNRPKSTAYKIFRTITTLLKLTRNGNLKYSSTPVHLHRLHILLQLHETVQHKINQLKHIAICTKKIRQRRHNYTCFFRFPRLCLNVTRFSEPCIFLEGDGTTSELSFVSDVDA